MNCISDRHLGELTDACGVRWSRKRGRLSLRRHDDIATVTCQCDMSLWDVEPREDLVDLRPERQEPVPVAGAVQVWREPGEDVAGAYLGGEHPREIGPPDAESVGDLREHGLVPVDPVLQRQI